MWFSWLAVLVWWSLWLYAPLFRAPLFQKRRSVTVAGPTRVGLLLECMAILIAFSFRVDTPRGLVRIVAAMALGAAGTVIMWTVGKAPRQAISHSRRSVRRPRTGAHGTLWPRSASDLLVSTLHAAVHHSSS